MKKTTLIQSPLAYCLAAAFGVTALTAAAQSPSASLERTELKMYAAQDKYAQESERLAAAGNYDKAIQILKENVVAELELKVQEVDSWRAKQRLAEFSAKLRALQLKYGTIKLRAAENAYAEGKYDNAITLAVEARNICDELTTDANEIEAAALSRKNSAVFRDKINPDKIDPELAKREKQIKAALAAARTFIQYKKYEQALVEIEKVYVLDPFNAEAAQLAHETYKAFYTIGFKRRKADTAGMAAYEAWQWVEPQFPREIHDPAKTDGSSVKSADDHGIQAKLDQIVIPSFRFTNADIEGMIDFLKKRYCQPNGILIDFVNKNVAEAKKDEAAAENSEDSEEPAPKRNTSRRNRKVAVDSDEEAEEEDNRVLVSIDVRNVTLRELLNYLSYLTHMTYSIMEDRVIFGTVGVNYAKTYAMAPEVITLIHNFSKGIDASRSSKKSDVEDEEESTGSSKSTSSVVLEPEDLKKFFKLYGIDFAEGSSINARQTTLTMSNTEANHRRLEELLQELNAEQLMVQVEVKSIELTENDMEELGFNWALGELSHTTVDKNGNHNFMGVNTGSNTSYDARGGSTKALSMLGSMLSGVDSRLVSNLNIFPDLLGSFKPFGSDQQLSLSLTINALDRSDRTEMISAPKVLVASGETASVKMGKSYFFPTGWDELEVEIEDSDGDNGYAYTLTLPTPTFGESELMGTNFTVTPRVLSDNRTIRLDVKPEIKNYVGKDEYFMDVLVYRGGRLSESESVRGLSIWRPVIATRNLDVMVDVYHGETLVLGGLSDSISQSRLDKIPILGDIPFIGRLFQSHSETSTRRNMLIFVTAKIMDSKGQPIRKMDGNFGIPEMGR